MYSGIAKSYHRCAPQLDKLRKEVIGKPGERMFLLGLNTEGEKVWLRESEWQCDWYWSVGYIAMPDVHTHWDCMLAEANREARSKGDPYIHHMNEVLTRSTLLEADSWKLADLMQSAYLLQKVAGYYRHGNSYIAGSKDDWKQPDKEKEINEKELPVLFERIYKLLGG